MKNQEFKIEVTVKEQPDDRLEVNFESDRGIGAMDLLSALDSVAEQVRKHLKEYVDKKGIKTTPEARKVRLEDFFE